MTDINPTPDEPSEIEKIETSFADMLRHIANALGPLRAKMATFPDEAEKIDTAIIALRDTAGNFEAAIQKDVEAAFDKVGDALSSKIAYLQQQIDDLKAAKGSDAVPATTPAADAVDPSPAPSSPASNVDEDADLDADAAPAAPPVSGEPVDENGKTFSDGVLTPGDPPADPVDGGGGSFGGAGADAAYTPVQEGTITPSETAVQEPNAPLTVEDAPAALAANPGAQLAGEPDLDALPSDTPVVLESPVSPPIEPNAPDVPAEPEQPSPDEAEAEAEGAPQSGTADAGVGDDSGNLNPSPDPAPGDGPVNL